MKKVKHIVYILIIYFLSIRSVCAFIIPDFTPLIPVAPQLCAQCIPSVITTLKSSIDRVKSIKDDFASGKILSQVEQMAKSYGMQLGRTAFNHLKKDVLKRKKVVSYSRTIKESRIGGDMTDEAQVKEAFIELFLQYPSDKGQWKKAYENKGSQMKIDTNVEMYVTAVEMSKELDEMLAELDNIEKCIVAGEDCSSVGMSSYNCQSGGEEDDACLWRNALMAVRIYDKIMQYNEFLLAMKTQLDAVRSIGGNVKIREYKKDDEKKTSYINRVFTGDNIQTASIEEKNSSSYAFASDNKFGFTAVKSAGIKGPMSGKEDDLMSLTVVKNAQDKLNDAMSFHNFKKMLPDYRNAFKQYHTYNKYYQKVLDNLYISDACSINHLGKYYVNGMNAWMGNNCKKTKNGYECEYKDNGEERQGEYNVACSDNSDKLCFALNQDNFNERSGISAWLMQLYEEANIEENSDDAEDIYMTMSSSDSGGQQSLSDAKKNASNKYNSDNSGSGEANLKKPSMEDDLYAEMRKNSLLSWTLGAEVAQKVVEDMSLKSPKFGSTKSIPLWNDQKIFYDLYLEGKYKNIRDYIKVMPLFSEMATFALSISDKMFVDVLDEEGNILVDKQKDREASRKAIQKLQNILSNDGGKIDTSEVDKALQEEAAVLSAIHASYLAQVQTYEALKAEIYKKLDKASADLSNVRDEMNQATKDEKQGEGISQMSDFALFTGKKLQRGSAVSPIDKLFNQKKNESDNLNLNAKSKKEQAIYLEKTLTKEIKNLRKELDKISEGMKTIDGAYVKKYSDKEYEFKQRFSNLSTSSNVITKISDITSILTSNSPLSVAKVIENKIREYALGIVDETENKINQLKSSNRLYYAENSAELQAIHHEMLNKLRKITLSDLISKVSLPEIISKIKITENIFKPFEASLDKILKGKETPDSEYFVGLVGKERDWTTPKPPLNFSSSSLRDVLHLDQDDFFSIKQYYKNNAEDIPVNNKEVTITKKSILDSGLKLPEIWKYILKNRSFVEKEIDLEILLNKGTPGLALVNRGIYPCKDTETGKSIAMTGVDQFVIVPQQSNQICRHVKLDGNRIYDIEGNKKYKYGSGSVVIDNNTSELGQILDYIKVYKQVCTTMDNGLPDCYNMLIEEKLTFRQELLNTLRILVNVQNSDISEEEKDAIQALYNSILFERNQFGNFLDVFEQATLAKEVRDNLWNNVQEIRAQLGTIFEEMGYELSEDFDLSLETDYQEAQDVLEEQKEGNINAAKNIIAQIKGTSERIMSDKTKLINQLKLLEEDKDELITVSGTEDIDEFRESLRTEIANRGVADEYSEEGDKKMNDNLNRLRTPYCSVY